jgi:ribosomal-protein-alanine N-acetyltransferase
MGTSRTYFLTSARLGFSTWTADDFPLAIGLWGDAEVTKLTGGPFTPSQVRERLSREMATREQHGIQYWPIFRSNDGAHVGCCGLHPYDPDKRIYELGFQLRCECWRKGYGHEAAAAAIAYGFNVVGAHGLYAGHHRSNEASKHVLQGLGFRYTHDEFYPPTQQIEPCYLLTMAEFLLV